MLKQRAVDITREDDVLAALQTLVSYVVTNANYDRIFGDRYNNDVTEFLYWHTQRPPLASVSFGCTLDRRCVGVHVTVFVDTYRTSGDPCLPDGFTERLGLFLPDGNLGVQFQQEHYGLRADLICPQEVLAAVGFVVRIARQRG